MEQSKPPTTHHHSFYKPPIADALRTMLNIRSRLGWDWKIGVGVIASFPAREGIIATLGTIYSLGGDIDAESSDLKQQLQAEVRSDGRKIYNVPVAMSIMVFFALCAQCAATLVVIKRETNSWFWPAFTFGYMTTLAYLGAFVTYQLGMLFV